MKKIKARNRTDAAKRAWETIRANKRRRIRIAAAKKAWDTIRAKRHRQEQAAEKAAKARGRSSASKKAWDTIRAKNKRYQSKFYYASALEKAWRKLIGRVKSNRLDPICEEDIQCALYHELVETLKTATDVHPKATKGGRKKKSMIFHDFSIGPVVEEPQVVVEIKFSRRNMNRRGSVVAGCKMDVKKMRRHHPHAVRYMFIFQQLPRRGEGENDISLDKGRLDELKRHDRKCRILYYPTRFTKDPNTRAALKAGLKHR